MSVLKSDIVNRIESGQKVMAIDIQAGTHLATARYVFTGTEAVGDEIELCPLHRDARVVPCLSFIWSGGVGTLSVKVGDEGAVSKFADTTSVGAAGVYPLKGGTGEAGSNVVNGTVKLTITAVTGPVAGKSLVAYISYVRP